MPADANIFQTLQQFSWRGLPLPLIESEVTISRDLVEHKFPDNDGAHVEDTGRDPLQISAKIPFDNFISPGNNETWPKGDLFPNHLGKFIDTLSDKTTGTLTHPLFGAVQAKIKTAKVPIDGSKRGGVTVDCEWIESTDRPDDLQLGIVSYAAFPTLASALQDLDNLGILTTIPKFPPPLPTSGLPKFVTFSQLLQKITGFADQVSSLSRNIANQYDTLIFQLKNVPIAYKLALDATAWPAQLAVNRALAAAYDLKKTKGAAAQRKIAIYVTKAPTTLGLLANTLKVNIADLVALNSDQAGAPVVPAFVPIRYYAPQ